MIPPPDVRVFHDHTLVATYPPGCRVQVRADGSIDVVHVQAQPDGSMAEVLLGSHPAGTWHAAGVLCCGYMDADPNCPSCASPASG